MRKREIDRQRKLTAVNREHLRSRLNSSFSHSEFEFQFMVFATSALDEIVATVRRIEDRANAK